MRSRSAAAAVSDEDAAFLAAMCARDELGVTDLERTREIARGLPHEVAGVPCHVQFAVGLPSGREVLVYDSDRDGGAR